MSESIEFRHLHYFLAVAETQNFTRAAQRLQVSQPTISQQVAHLERELGAALFRRIGKRVQLTEAGMAFQKSAEAVMRKLQDARDSVHEVTGLIAGHVQLGVIPALHVAWVPPVLAHMAHDYPGVTVGVRQLASSAVETDLEAGRLDLGFGLVSTRSPSMRYERLESESFSLLVPEGSSFAAAKAVDARHLEGARLVMLPGSFDMRRAADEVLRRLRARPRAIFEIDNIDSVLATVARAGTPTLLPPIVLRGREALRLRAIPLAAKTRSVEFGLIWAAASSASPAALALAASLKTGMAQP